MRDILLIAIGVVLFCVLAALVGCTPPRHVDWKQIADDAGIP